MTRPARMRPVSHRLAMVTMTFVLVASVLVGALQLRMQYLDDVAATRGRLAEIERSLVPNLAEAVWMVDGERIEMLLDGAMGVWGLAHARVATREGEVFERGRDPGDGAIQRKRFALVHHGHRAIPLGTLEVEMDDTAILAAIRDRALSRSIGVAVAISLGAGLMLLLVRHWITRHLESMVRYARAIGPDTLHVPLALAGKPSRTRDEVDEVVEAFNRMRITMLEDQLRRRRDELELTAHRERLEELVAARTRQLTDTARELEAQRDAVQRLANTDALTGVGSRRHFQECADRELARAQRDERPVSLLMLDIDHFKRINDTHGHGVGDLVLKRFAQVLQHHVGTAACIGRLGGEEFAVVLSGWDTTRARALAELVRTAVMAAPVAVGGPGEVAYTTSMGLATWRPGGPAPSLERLLREADAALYRAKAAGRNRVEAASPA